MGGDVSPPPPLGGSEGVGVPKLWGPGVRNFGKFSEMLDNFLKMSPFFGLK